MMVNYYQKMRERNNEASKRCRLKRRIKQDSLDKTRILLESHREALSHRVAKLHKIKTILNDACRNIGEDPCECREACNLIKCANREMPDLLDLSNCALLRKSRRVRETNLEELLANDSQHRLQDLRPLKRGPRKQDDTATMMIVDTLSPCSSSGALDLSSSSTLPLGVPVKREVPGEDRKYGPVTLVSKPYMPLAPKAASTPTIRKIIVDNPGSLHLSPSTPMVSPSGLPLLPQRPVTLSLPSFTGPHTTFKQYKLFPNFLQAATQ